MKIKKAPSGSDAYWFERIGEHEILHVGCFSVTVERAVQVYAELLARLYNAESRLWIEFQSSKRWWLNQRRRDRKLSLKGPAYEDESYLAFDVHGELEIGKTLERFWLLKELRCYFWSQQAGAIDPQVVLPAMARTEFRQLVRYIPSVARFVAEREICSSYLRVMFHQNEARFVERIFGETASKAGIEFVLEASIFRECVS